MDTATASRESEIFRRRRMKLNSKGKVGNSLETLYKVNLEKANGVMLTTSQVQYMFNVTPMTVYNWRKTRNMPFYTLEGHKKPPVRFDEGLVLDWAFNFGRKVENQDYETRFK